MYFCIFFGFWHDTMISLVTAFACIPLSWSLDFLSLFMPTPQWHWPNAIWLTIVYSYYPSCFVSICPFFICDAHLILIRLNNDKRAYDERNQDWRGYRMKSAHVQKSMVWNESLSANTYSALTLRKRLVGLLDRGHFECCRKHHLIHFPIALYLIDRMECKLYYTTA